MSWEDDLKCGGRWLSRQLPGSENGLWKFGKQAFELDRAEELSALTEWLKTAEFESPSIGDEADQRMFRQLATGMACGLAALGNWKQGHSVRCQELLQRAAAAYQQFLEPAAVIDEASDASSLSLTETAGDERALEQGLTAVEAQYPIGGAMLRTLLACLVPGLQRAHDHRVLLRVLLDDTLGTGETPVLQLRRYPASYDRRLWYPDPVWLGCTVLNREFLETLQRAWQCCEDALPKVLKQPCRISWGLQMGRGCKHLNGPSAGAVFAAGLRGLAEGLEFDTGVAMTAAISREGQLESVGFIPQKIKAACDKGVRHFVLCPQDAEKHRDELKANHPTATIVAAKNVDDTLEHLTGQAKEVREFLENLIEQGLLRHVRQRPRHLETGWEIAEFCLRPRVVDADRWEELKKQKKDGKKSRLSGDDEDPGYMMPSHEQFLRGGGEIQVVPRPLLPPDKRRVVLEGEPGEGKTTALWLMVAEQCKDLLGKLKQGESVTTAPEYRVPLVLPLGTIDEEKRRHSLIHNARDYVLQHSGESKHDPQKLKAWLDGKISRGEYTLYLDALDELPQAERGQRWLWEQLDSLPNEIPLLLTTRTSVGHLARTRIRNPQRYRIVCFATREVRQYVERYFQDQPDLARDLLDRQRLSPGPRQLMQLPLLLALLCELKQRHPTEPLPRTRTELLRRALYGIFERGDEKRDQEESSPRRCQQKERVLRHVAWTFHAAEPIPMPEDDLLDVLEKHRDKIRKDPPEDEEALLKEFLQDGILVRTGDEQYGFVLRTLHEYCLAGWIAHEAPFLESREHFQQVIQGSGTDWGRTEWGDLQPLFDDNWEHVWPLVAGQMAERGGWLLGTISNTDQLAMAETVVAEALELAAVVVAEVSEHLDERRRFIESLISRIDDPRGSNNVRLECAWSLRHIKADQSREVLIRQLTNSDTPKSIRGQCALALGEIGDERSRDALFAQLIDSEISESVRQDCAHALGEIRDERSRDGLIAWLNNTEASDLVRGQCALALGRISDEWSREALIARLEDPDTNERVRGICAWAFHQIRDKQSREQLIELLEDPNTPEFVREQCALALGEIADARSLDALIARLDDHDTSEDVIRGCTWGLRHAKDESSRDALIKRIDGPELSESTRQLFVSALGEIGDERSLTVIIAQLDNPKTPVSVRGQCAVVLGDIGDEWSRDALIVRMDDPETSEEIRGACAWSLGNIKSERPREKLITRLDDPDTSESIREQCALALGRIGDKRARDVLIAWLGNPDAGEEVKRGCAWGLRNVGDEPSRKALIARLDEPEIPESFRQLCVSALSEIGDEQSREALIARLNDPDANEEIRAACAWSLRNIKGGRTHEILAARLDDPNTADFVRGQCAHALGELGDEQSREALIACLDDPITAEDIRVQCIAALGQIGDECSREALIARLDDPDTAENIRRVCTWTLGEIGGP